LVAVQTRLIESYELLLEQSSRMLECALRGEWAEIMELKSQGIICEESLRQQEAVIQLTPRDQARKRELLTQILELDIEVRKRLMARQNELGELLQAGRRRRDLNRAYRQPVGGLDRA
jgi:flagellar protein FliT